MYTRAGTFVTAFYAVLDPAERTLTYSSAGHNPPRLVRGGRVLSLNEAASIPLGILPDQAYGEATFQLERGDLLLLYTDGITEAMPTVKPSESPDLFGVERLDHVLLEGRESDTGACLERIKREISAFTHDAAPSDDRTLIALRCR